MKMEFRNQVKNRTPKHIRIGESKTWILSAKKILKAALSNYFTKKAPDSPQETPLGEKGNQEEMVLSLQ